MTSRMAVMELESVEDCIGLDPLEIQNEVNAPTYFVPHDVDNYFEFDERKSPLINSRNDFE